MTKQVFSVDSVFPPTKFLTFGTWIYLVPQYKPKNALILGYAGGTVAGLIRLLYGELPITAIDINRCEPTYGVEFIQSDARDFVGSCDEYDAVIVDLFTDSGMPDFVTDEGFVSDLKRIANYVAINTVGEPDMKHYDRLMVKVGTNKPSRLSNLIHYYRNKDIPDLRPF